MVDLTRAEQFYCQVLKLEVIKRWPWPDGRPGERSLWLRLAPGFLALEACDGPAVEKPFRDPGGGIHLLALSIPASERASWEARLGPRIIHRTSYTLYVQDPEGNRIALSHHPEEAR